MYLIVFFLATKEALKEFIYGPVLNLFLTYICIFPLVNKTSNDEITKKL